MSMELLILYLINKVVMILNICALEIIFIDDWNVHNNIKIPHKAFDMHVCNIK